MKEYKNRIKSLKQRYSKAKALRSKVLYPLDKLSYSVYFLLFGKKDAGESLIGYSESTRVLLFSPHQDDETLGCGGLLLASRDKATIQTVYVTNGRGPESARTEPERIIEAKTRFAEAELVCDAIQINKPINLGFDAIKIGSCDELLIKKSLIKLHILSLL